MNDFHVVMPVLIVAAYGLLVLVFTPAFPGRDTRLLAAASFIGLVVAAVPVLRLRGYTAEAAGGLAFEVDLDQDGRLVADDPAVVAGLDRDHLGRGELGGAAVGVADADPAARDEADVRVHAEVGADGPLHVRRPAEAGLVDHAFDTAGTGAGDVHLDAAQLPAVGARNRREQRIGVGHGQCLSRGIGSLPSAPAVSETNSGSFRIDANTASTRASIISLLLTASYFSYSKK